MKTGVLTLINGMLRAFKTPRRACFCNIAEGTHAGRITMRAAGDIAMRNLLVTLENGDIKLAGAFDRPVGVSLDAALAGDLASVQLAGCDESTAICVAASPINAGETLYTAANGKVSPAPAAGAYKVGVALTSAAANGALEVNPQGFGQRAYALYACGVHVWNTATASSGIAISGLKADDAVLASIAVKGASEKSVTAKISADLSQIEFSLDANGAQGSTKVAWFVARSA